jgi:hypothetical protein
MTEEEEDIIALARNLYWPEALNIFSARKDLAENFMPFMSIRRLNAIAGVAHNSFAHIIGLKAASSNNLGPDSGAAYMKSMMLDLGISATEVDQLLGENPSYYAQMEVLTKKIYQDPNFYTNLYDKPANVDRIGASMEALKLMQGRDHFEASLRKEMLLSMMVEHELNRQFRNLNDKISPSNR